MTGLFAVVLAASLGSAPEPGPVALLVANDVGFESEPPLSSTGSDAERLARVLHELGGFDRKAIHIVRNKTAAEILDAVDAVARGAPSSTLLFYYSGHADGGALHPAGTLLPIDLLLHRLRAVNTGLRISILDACQSGAAMRARGSRPAGPVRVDVGDLLPEGEILISSSAADEQSFETGAGGVFTSSFVTALRGAADSNRDGLVTVSEAYEYTYAQTLRVTLASSFGPQHPRFRYDITGRRDPVLTRLDRACSLTFQPQSDGEYVVFDGRERSVLAELPARAGSALRVALAPGDYFVHRRDSRSLRVARVALRGGDDLVLADHQMQEAPLARLTRRGSLGDLHVTITGGQHSTGLGPEGAFIGSVGVEWEGARWTYGAEVAGSSAGENHLQLRTLDTTVQLSGFLLHGWQLGTASLRLGPALGTAYLRQDTIGRTPLQSIGVSLGCRVRGDLQVTQNIAVLLVLEARALTVRMRGNPEWPGLKASPFGIVPWLAYGLGVRVAL